MPAWYTKDKYSMAGITGLNCSLDILYDTESTSVDDSMKHGVF